MFCNQCGNQVPDQAQFCPVCGNVMKPAGADPSVQAGGMPIGYVPKKRIDNIFSAIGREQSTGNILELVAFIACCIAAIFSFLAAVLVDGSGSDYTSFRLLWIFVMLFGAGLAVLIAFRLKAISILSGATAFYLILFLPYFLCAKGVLDGDDLSVFVILMFTIAILVGIAYIACSSVQFFSRFQLDKPIMILAIVSMATLFLLCVFQYLIPKSEIKKAYRESYAKQIENYEEEIDEYKSMMNQGDIDSDDYEQEYDYYQDCIEEEKEQYKDNLSDLNKWYREGWGDYKYGMGSFGYLLLAFTVGLYTLAYFKEIIECGNQKIIAVENISYQRETGNYQNQYATHTGMAAQPKAQMQSPVRQKEVIGVQCLQGTHAGKTFPVQGEILIGSKPGNVHIVIQDTYISRTHCAVRYNAARGQYEVKDMSTNGVFFIDGRRLQKDTYTPCQRGSVIYLGNSSQQFKLL